jgi:hypothetical protein
MRIAIVLAACLALAGCFTSETPLYAERDGACPVQTATTFTVQQVDAGGRFADMPVFTIRPEGRLCVRTPEGTPDAAPEPALLVAFENGWYVVQREKDEGSVGDRYLYQLARFEGDRVEIYMPSCGDFTSAALSELGVERVQMDTAPQPVQFDVPAPPPIAPYKPRPERGKQAAGGEVAESPFCRVTTRAQLENVLRRWITLGRPPSESGRRQP